MSVKELNQLKIKDLTHISSGVGMFLLGCCCCCFLPVLFICLFVWGGMLKRMVTGSLVPRPSSLVGKNKGEEGLVELIT